MRPDQPKRNSELIAHLFNPLLSDLLDRTHELYQLTDKIDWAWLDQQCSELYAHNGRKAIPTRMMAGLHLLKHAKQHSIKLRQSYTRVSKTLAIKVGRYAHAKQFKRMRRDLKKLKARLGRLERDITREIAGNAQLEEHFRSPLYKAHLIRTQN